jgi:NAD(P)-dependent dehydrogenase (short-subunit alcohol dehydrogenase family)
MRRFPDLTGKTVLLTGASTGIGRETARGLSSIGARMYLLGRSIEALEELREELTPYAEMYSVDLRSPTQVDEAVSAIEGKCGSIDILMNCAGVWHDDQRAFVGNELSEIAAEEIAQVLGVGLHGSLYLTRRVLPGMRSKRSGKILFISCGFAGPHEASGWLHYYVANKAIEALTRGLAAECRPYNIQVNCVAPWFVATEAVKRFFPEKQGTALTPRQVAEAAVLLVSRESDNLSGQVLELRSNMDY